MMKITPLSSGTRWIRRFSWLLITLTLATLAVEALLRQPKLAQALMPPAHVAAVQQKLGNSYERDTWLRWSNLYFRSRHVRPDLSLPASTQTTILVLGDSYSWGDHIHALSNVWPYVMEDHLRAQGHDVRVVNLAQGGFTTVNEVELLERNGWNLNPSIILLQYLVNDPLPSGPDFQREGGAWLLTPAPPLLPWPRLHRWLERHSYAYSWFNETWRSARANNLHQPDRTFTDLYRDDFAGWQASTQAIHQLAVSARNRNIPVLVVIPPIFTPENISLDERGYRYTDLHAKAAEAFRRNNLERLDLLTTFAAANPDTQSWWVLPVDGHPNLAAHRLIGQTLAEEIQRRWFAPGQPVR